MQLATIQIQKKYQLMFQENKYFHLSNISLHTNENNRCIVCYGDSITAQDWPDYLSPDVWQNLTSLLPCYKRFTNFA